MIVIPIGLLLIIVFLYLVIKYVRHVPEVTPAGITAWKKLPIDYKRSIKEMGLKPSDFTCATCPIVTTCRSRYDAFNTNGDCLEEK